MEEWGYFNSNKGGEGGLTILLKWEVWEKWGGGSRKVGQDKHPLYSMGNAEMSSP